MKTDKELLIEGRAVISKPEGWTQQVFARNTEGKEVDEDSPDAVCFCSWGALNRVMGHSTSYDSPLYKHLEKAMERSVTLFNDTHTHEEVLAAWDKAIAEA